MSSTFHDTGNLLLNVLNYFPEQPVMTASPQLLAKERMIEVKWQAWERTQGGDGPVLMYKVYWKSKPTKWTTEEVRDDIRTYVIDKLTPNTDYEVAVTAVRPGFGGEGPKSPTAQTRTQCDGMNKFTIIIYT